MTTAAVVLCGGRSYRMGHDKASLPFGPETLVERIVRLLGEAVEPSRIVVVTAQGQGLPTLPVPVIHAVDRHPDRGPLEALAAGLGVLPASVDAAFVTSCDAPLVSPAFINSMFDRLGDADIAVPIDAAGPHPLAAVYRPSVLEAIDQLLAKGIRRMQSLLENARTVRVPAESLRDIDPELQSLWNLNEPADYLRALQQAGFSPPAGFIKPIRPESP